LPAVEALFQQKLFSLPLLAENWVGTS